MSEVFSALFYRMGAHWSKLFIFHTISVCSRHMIFHEMCIDIIRKRNANKKVAQTASVFGVRTYTAHLGCSAKLPMK